MGTNEPSNDFEEAVKAFEVKFALELDSRWERLEIETRLAFIDALVAEKRTLLSQFFDDARREIALAIHQYFSVLLNVATTQRKHLGNQSPLTWTQAEILRQVGNFLSMDEKFDENSPSKDDSRVLRTAERICTGKGWLDDGSPTEFRLPRCLVRKPGIAQYILGNSSDSGSVNDVEPFSHAETLAWVKVTESWVWRAAERQIEDECRDGIIEAGKSGISVLQNSAVDAREAPDETEAPCSMQSEQGKAQRTTAQEGAAGTGPRRAAAGRPPRLSSDFVEVAGTLWLNIQRRGSGSHSNVKARLNATDEDLGVIATILDSKGYIPPAEYLEKEAADDLKRYNSRNSNSKAGAIKTWTQLVSVADKDHLRGMRKLLSRCAKKVNSELPDRVRK